MSMKLYVLFDNNNDVRAHTRDEETFKKYLKSIKKKDRLYPKIVNEPKIIKQIEDTYYKQVIWYDDEIEESDTEYNKPLFDFAREEYDKLQFMIKDLKNIISNYDISKKDKKQLKQSLKILKELSKKKNFKKAVGSEFVSELSKNSRHIDLLRVFNIGDKQK